MNYQEYLINKYNFLQVVPYSIQGNVVTSKDLTPINKVELKMSISLAELNIVKAHSRILLRAFSGNKDLSFKNETDFIIISKIVNKIDIFRIISIMNLLYNYKVNFNESVTVHYSDILLFMQQLDIQRVNTKSLSEIILTLDLTKKHKVILNEILRTQR